MIKDFNEFINEGRMGDNSLREINQSIVHRIENGMDDADIDMLGDIYEIIFDNGYYYAIIKGYKNNKLKVFQIFRMDLDWNAGGYASNIEEVSFMNWSRNAKTVWEDEDNKTILN